MENEVFCCCVSKFIRILVGETFSSTADQGGDEKDLFKKKKKTTTQARRRESEKNKGEIREILWRDNNKL